MKNIISKIVIILMSALIAWFSAGYFAALYITKSEHGTIPRLKYINSFPVEEWDIISGNEKISAWFIRNNAKRAVILLAGIRGNRVSQISRAKLYLNKGFSVLMPDLRGTGQSDGEIISFGWHEHQDLIACVLELEKKGYKRIGVHGQSLGAATIAYSLDEIKNYQFIIMESCYDNIENAFRNRVSKYHLPYFVYIPIIVFAEKIIKIRVDALAPAEYVKKIDVPILFLAGDSEKQLKLSETKSLYNNCHSKDKDLYIFKGGMHVDFLKRFPNEYKRIWMKFIDTYGLSI